MKQILFSFLLLVSVFYGQAISAEIFSGSSDFNLNLNGFLTFGSTRFKSQEGVYYSVAHDSSKVSYESDTKAGLQVSLDYLNDYTLTAQLIAKGADDYDPELSWFNLSYKFSQSLRGRAGRMRTPVYLFSENSDINYSYPMLRPSDEVYFQVLMERIEGIELLSNHMIGDWDLNFQATYGGAEEDVWVNVNYEAFVLSMMATNYEYTFRVSLAKAEVSSSMYDKLANYFIASGISPETTRDFLEVHDDPATFLSIGMIYDFENIVLIAEYAKRKVKTLFPSAESFSILAGYRFGKALPYIQYGAIKATDAYDKRYNYQSPYETYVINEYVKAVAHIDQLSVALGMRYDFTDKISITAEWKKISAEDRYFGILSHDDTASGPLDDSYLTSLLVDIVF